MKISAPAPAKNPGSDNPVIYRSKTIKTKIKIIYFLINLFKAYFVTKNNFLYLHIGNYELVILNSL